MVYRLIPIINSKNKNLDNNIQLEYYTKVLFSLEPTPSASKLDLLQILLYAGLNMFATS